MRWKAARLAPPPGQTSYPAQPSPSCIPARCGRSPADRLVRCLDEVGPDRIIHVHRGTRIQRERADRLLLHLFQHQVHHRGQAHAMLSSTTVPPPQLDEFFSIAEAPLRVAEFEELGWTELEIWREQPM